MSDNKYKSDYLKLSFYSIGGRWGYAIMQLKDANDEVKVRLAKCKTKNEFPSTKKYEWTDIAVEHIENMSQVQKINFKPTDNFQNLAEKIIQELAVVKELNEGQKEGKE
jgi:hypothetical protein